MRPQLLQFDALLVEFLAALMRRPGRKGGKAIRPKFQDRLRFRSDGGGWILVYDGWAC